MKMNMFDVLDKYDGCADNINLNNDLSPALKSEIMDRIKPKKVIKHSKKFVSAIIAAAAVLCLSITVYAVSTNWYGIYNSRYDDDKNFSIAERFVTDTSCAAVISDGDVKIELLGTSPMENGMVILLKGDAGKAREKGHFQNFEYEKIVIDGVNLNDTAKIQNYFDYTMVEDTYFLEDNFSNYPIYDYLKETEFLSIIRIIGSPYADINGKTASITLTNVSDYNGTDITTIHTDEWKFDIEVKTSRIPANTESIEFRSYARNGANYGTATLAYLSPTFAQIVLEWDGETFVNNWVYEDEDGNRDFDVYEVDDFYNELTKTIKVHFTDGVELYLNYESHWFGEYVDKNGNAVTNLDDYELSDLSVRVYINKFMYWKDDDIETLSIAGQKLPFNK